jgi:hypothetical protein
MAEVERRFGERGARKEVVDRGGTKLSVFTMKAADAESKPQQQVIRRRHLNIVHDDWLHMTPASATHICGFQILHTYSHAWRRYCDGAMYT